MIPDHRYMIFSPPLLVDKLPESRWTRRQGKLLPQTQSQGKLVSSAIQGLVGRGPIQTLCQAVSQFFASDGGSYSFDICKQF